MADLRACGRLAPAPGGPPGRASGRPRGCDAPSPAAIAAIAVIAGIAALAPVLAPDPAIAGAWTQEPGRGLTIVAGSFAYGDAAFDSAGRLQPVPDYRKFELSTYTEYGATEWLTMLVAGRLRDEQNGDVRAGSVGAAAAGARVRLHRAPSWVFAAELTALSGDIQTTGLTAGSDAAGLDSRILFGYGATIQGRPAYVDVQAGYRWRSGATPDEVRVDLTLGLTAAQGWDVLAQLFSTYAVEGDPVLNGERYNYHKLQLSAVRRINDRLSVQAGGFTTVFGANALREFGGLLGVWYRW